MDKTRKHFTQDYLVYRVRRAVKEKLEAEACYAKKVTQILNSMMSGLGVFTFKYPSLLKFDELRNEKEGERKNIETLFGVIRVPSDTHMRSTLDEASPEVLQSSFKILLSLLQRAKILEQYLFMDKYYLISVDGTGYYSSTKVNCAQCLIKEHKNGSKEYHHQMLSAAMVHPKQKVVFPLAPEPIMNTDGSEKNDCERNAFKRWIKHFRKEHPHLKVIILADGLSSNAPFVEILKEYGCSYILVCKDGDHKYLVDWVKDGDKEDAPIIEEIASGSIHRTYQYMNDVPINETNYDCKVNVIICHEKNPKNKNPTKWMWITDIEVTKENVKALARAGRSRWKIENETFNTLKNQGYEFEHNFGHGNKNLSTVFAFLMMLSFFIDQCLQGVNKLFQQAYEKCRAKYALWEEMRATISRFILPSFEKLYEVIIHPPPPIDLMSCDTQS